MKKLKQNHILVGIDTHWPFLNIFFSYFIFTFLCSTQTDHHLEWKTLIKKKDWKHNNMKSVYSGYALGRCFDFEVLNYF